MACEQIQQVYSRCAGGAAGDVLPHESLFLRDSKGKEWNEKTALFAIGCADLFQYTNHAILLSRRLREDGIIDDDLQKRVENVLKDILTIREKKSVFEKIRIPVRWIGRKLGF